MSPANIATLTDSEPPNIDHGVIALTIILILIKGSCHVTVAVVTEYVMVHALIHLVSLSHRLIILYCI